tara:strand:- start:340 stop:633 length:294 start_codon:yes stop_codon:yes gene_type:complete
MGAEKTVLVTVAVIAGLLLLALSWGASYAVDYLDESIADECEDEQGTLVELIGADGGECQGARNLQDQVASIGQMLGYLGVACLLVSAALVAIRNRQ